MKHFFKKKDIGRLPNVILIGGSKCGSTSLFEYLSNHPEIDVCKEKEPHFFTKHWNRGLSWYKSCFIGDAKLMLEGSTSYSNYPWFTETPERIKSTVPSVKLIYIVRHPIKRLISQVHHNMIMGRLNADEVYSENFWNQRGARYIHLSKYYMQISQYLKFFDRSQLHVLSLEELSNQPMDTLRNLSEFLEVPADVFMDENIYKKYNVSNKRNKLKSGLFYKALRVASRLQKKGETQSGNVPKPVFTNEVIEFIWNQIDDDMRLFENYTEGRIFYKKDETINISKGSDLPLTPLHP